MNNAGDRIIYGFHSAEEALKNQPRSIHQMWVSAGHHSPRLHRLIQEARRHNVPVKVVDKAALTRLAENIHHQDIVLELSSYQYHDAEDLLGCVTEQSLFCILDEIQDATNLGTLLRTMEGAGVDGVFLPERRAAAVTAATHRLSAGALEHVRIARVVNLARLIEQMQDKGIRVICADASAPKLWHEADYTGPIAILVGNEQKGVRRLLKEKSDELVRIPMKGKLQSLNVNVAAAILLYEVLRQRVEIPD
jgi:23S rRNA (guanosine2251-2'-O)-methyltransferase